MASLSHAYSINDPVEPHEPILTSGVLDVTVRACVQRMLGWCEKTPQAATFLARGVVVDTIGDIGAQIHAYFPSNIDTAPILDDIAFVVSEAAEKNGQRFQEISLEHIGDGKIPEAARANLQTFVKWYAADTVSGGDFDGHHKKLRPGWSGGAGAPTDMLKYLNLGTRKGFLLQVCALDINDARTKALMGDAVLGMAFGGNPEALAAASGAVASGGEVAAAIQEVAEATRDIKIIKAALEAAGDTPQATPLAAALALKTSQLADLLPATSVPMAVRQALSQTFEGVHIVLTARQLTQAISIIAPIAPAMPAGTPPVALATPANLPQQARATITELQTSIANLRNVAAAQGMTVRDALIISLAGHAPTPVLQAVTDVTKVLAQPNLLPTLETVLPPARAMTLREALITPAQQVLLQTPASIPALAQAITAAAMPPATKSTASAVATQQTILAESPIAPTLRMAGTALGVSADAPPVLKQQAIQAVADNLNAILISNAVTPALRAPLVILAAQAQAAAQQPMQQQGAIPAVAPVALSPQSPLSTLANAAQIETPKFIQPPAPPVSTNVTTDQIAGPHAATPQIALAAAAATAPTIQPAAAPQQAQPVQARPAAPQAAPVTVSAPQPQSQAQPAAQAMAPQATAPTIQPAAAPQQAQPVQTAPVAPQAMAPQATAPTIQPAATPQQAQPVQTAPVAPQAAPVTVNAPQPQSQAQPAPRAMAPQATAPTIQPAATPQQAQPAQAAPAIPATKVPVFESPVARAAVAIAQDRQGDSISTKPTKKPDTQAKGGCTNCTKGFNCAACAVMTQATVAALDSQISGSALKERRAMRLAIS